MPTEGEPDGLEDNRLMLAIAAGNKRAFSNLARRYLPRLVEFVMRYVKHKSDAEDIVQEVFIRVWQAAPKWKDQAIPVRNWIYKIAYNKCIDELRKNTRLTTISVVDYSDSSDTIETIAVQQIQLELIQKLIAKLPERQRTALMLCVFHEFSNKDAALVLDVSTEALESLLSRARRNLREQLKFEEN